MTITTLNAPTVDTPTVDPRIAKRLSEIAKQRAAIPESGTLPLSTTHDEAAAFATQRALFGARIADIQKAAEVMASLGSDEADQKWRDHLTQWRGTIDDDLLAMHPRIRNEKELEVYQRLKFSSELIVRGWAANRLPGPIIDLSHTRIGELMLAAGYEVAGEALYGPRGFRGSLPEVEQRLKVFARQHASAQAALDAALVDDEARAKREAEDKVFRATIGTMRIRGSGPSLVAFTLDGDPLDVSDMTPAQRKAFERFEAAQAPVMK